MKRKIGIVILIILILTAALVWGKEEPLTNWLQDPVTPLAKDVRTNFWISLLGILPFLFLSEGLLFYAIVKFRAKPNAKPATFHENVRLEIAWTILPALALVIIAIPTFTTLKKMEVPPKSDLVVEIIGHQFFWEYKYPKYEINFAEKPLVVPVNKVVTVNLTSVDVIHSWFVPAFGVKQDANPGRITHAWFKALETGTYKGQCAELCGALHALMYITVNVVSEEEFEAWVAKNKPVPVLPTPVKSKT